MMRFAEVDLPKDRPVYLALTAIHGIGGALSKKILAQAGVGDVHKRVGDLSIPEILGIRRILDGGLLLGGSLRRHVAQNIQRLRKIGCHRGIRHYRCLPVRDQHTRNDARTRKKFRKASPVRVGFAFRPLRRRSEEPMQPRHKAVRE